MKIADAIDSGANAAPTPLRRRKRRTYTAQFKAQVVAQCLQPGASVSAISLSHGINTNVIRKWLPEQRPAVAAPQMLPVTLKAEAIPVVATVVKQACPAVPRAAIEVCLADATLRLPPGFDPQDLAAIVQILRAPR